MEPGQEWVIWVLIGGAAVVAAAGLGARIALSWANDRFNKWCEKKGWKVTDKKD